MTMLPDSKMKKENQQLDENYYHAINFNEYFIVSKIY